MRIAVLVKEVPDTYQARRLDLESGLADRAATDSVLDEINERALEVALRVADGASDTEIVLVSMTPGPAVSTLRKGLAMGATSAVQVVDSDLHGADLGLTARVLAATLRRTQFDLVIGGNQSTDGSGGVLPSMIAELLGIPVLASLASAEISGERVDGVRVVDGERVALHALLPAVISITEAFPDARFASIKGVIAAKKKPYETLTLAELGIHAADPNSSQSLVVAVSERPARQAGAKIVDDGSAGKALADFLIQNHLA